MRHIEKEWFVFVCVDKFDSPLGEALGKVIGVGIKFEDLLAFQQWQGREVEFLLLRVIGMYVVAIRKPKELVESLTGGEKFGLIAKVPLAEHAGFVAC